MESCNTDRTASVVASSPPGEQRKREERNDISLALCPGTRTIRMCLLDGRSGTNKDTFSYPTP